jgi:hypothetical protein
MADKHIDILKSLKNCHIKPPSNLFKRIWRVLKMGKANSRDSSFPITDLTENRDNDQEHYVASEIEIFRSLQNYIVTPPAFSTLNIADSIANKTNASFTQKPSQVVRFKYFGKVAAAILVISCAIWIGYNKINSKNEGESTVGNVLTKNGLPHDANNTPVNNVSTGIKSNADNNNLKSISKKQSLFARVDKRDRINTKSNLKSPGNSIAINSYDKLIDNDILLTLVSYNYTDYQPLLSEIKKDNKIKLDQFSYITVSDKMNSLLKKMYATKRNNRPTRKAKKLRTKIEKWKKSDENHFDANTNNNPVDAIDLSEFIFK